MELSGLLAEFDWESHRPAVFGAAYRVPHPRHVDEAEDVTQEVWLRAAAADRSIRGRPGMSISFPGTGGGPQRNRLVFAGIP